MKWIEAGKVNSYLFTSSCSVYPQTGVNWLKRQYLVLVFLKKEDYCWQLRVILPPPRSIARSFILGLGGIYGPDFVGE